MKVIKETTKIKEEQKKTAEVQESQDGGALIRPHSQQIGKSYTERQGTTGAQLRKKKKVSRLT